MLCFFKPFINQPGVLAGSLKVERILVPPGIDSYWCITQLIGSFSLFRTASHVYVFIDSWDGNRGPVLPNGFARVLGKRPIVSVTFMCPACVLFALLHAFKRQVRPRVPVMIAIDVLNVVHHQSIISGVTPAVRGSITRSFVSPWDIRLVESRYLGRDLADCALNEIQGICLLFPVLTGYHIHCKVCYPIGAARMKGKNNKVGGGDSLFEKIEHNWLEIAAASLLALATVMSAWSAYNSSRWHARKHRILRQADTARVESSELITEMIQTRSWTRWCSLNYMNAIGEGNARMARSNTGPG